MNKEELKTEISTKIKNIADSQDLELNDNTQFDDIDEWDSLNTVDLEMELESSLNISFETGEFQEYKTIGELTDSIANKVA